ncbi:MAG: guanylate kinase [Alphaproteobacteria bacterium]|tara:strand:- start:196 stop:825 length:630 start_codon:yes stop_codon:yes gene_type:complete
MTKKNKRKGLMLVLSSPSGAGKTSICRKLLEIENDLVMSISYTTRKKRKSETNGIDYFFVSDNEFEKLKNNDFFIEYANVFDNWYGTPKKIVIDHMQNGVDVVFDIDWQGAQKLYNFSSTDMVSIFILPPTNHELSNRLKNRDEDSDDTVSLRMSKAKSEISHWIEYDYVLINENLDECVKEVLTILYAERKKKSRQNFLFEMVGKLLE